MIYLDSAATTLQKPPEVARASAWAIQNCSSPGRGDHISTRRAEEIMFACRSELAELFDAEGPEQVVFTQNATHALNLAIRTLVHNGDRVVISAWEHNAVTRTLYSIPGVEVLVAQAPLFDDAATLEAFRTLIREKQPAAVICTCVSNVFGYILPFSQIAALCAQAQVPLVLDAAQAAGSLPVHLRALKADYIAFPGHKGLYGPQGTGGLVCAQGRSIEAALTGGTGSESQRQEMPDFLPDRGEAGTQNVAGVAGLLQGVRFVRRVGVERIAGHEKRLLRQLRMGLKDTQALTARCSDQENQMGVVSLISSGMDCQELAQRLGERGIAVRAGLHCAPLAHRSGGTLESGTVRVSFSAFNQPREIDVFLRQINGIIHNKLT